MVGIYISKVKYEHPYYRVTSDVRTTLAKAGTLERTLERELTQHYPTCTKLYSLPMQIKIKKNFGTDETVS